MCIAVARLLLIKHIYDVNRFCMCIASSLVLEICSLLITFVIQMQNPSNKREIKCDTKLKSIFDGRDKVGMFEISKLISPHFLKPN